LRPAMHGRASWKLGGYGNATNYGANKLRFVSPVPAGAKVHAHSRLVGAESHPKGTQVTQEIQVHVVGQDRPALIYEMVVLYHPAMKRGEKSACARHGARDPCSSDRSRSSRRGARPTPSAGSSPASSS